MSDFGELRPDVEMPESHDVETVSTELFIVDREFASILLSKIK